MATNLTTPTTVCFYRDPTPTFEAESDCKLFILIIWLQATYLSSQYGCKGIAIFLSVQYGCKVNVKFTFKYGFIMKIKFTVSIWLQSDCKFYLYKMVAKWMNSLSLNMAAKIRKQFIFKYGCKVRIKFTFTIWLKNKNKV